MADKSKKDTAHGEAPDSDDANTTTVESASFDDPDDEAPAPSESPEIKVEEAACSERSTADASSAPKGVRRPELGAGTSRRSVVMALVAGLAVGAGGGFGGGYYWATRRRRRPSGPRPPLGRAYVPIEPWNPRKGANPAKVTVVEFSDFQ